MCEHDASGGGTEYQIGPGEGQLGSIAALDWGSLQPGDTVRIFWRSQPYAEKILLKNSGTAEHPIRICGVPNPATGELPTLNGVDAVTPQQFAADFGDTTQNHLEDLGILVVWNREYTVRPKHLRIEGLRIRGGQPDRPGESGVPNYYVSAAYGVRRWDDFAACIRVQEGDDIRIIGNELSYCSLGIVTISQAYNRESLTTRPMIEGNVLFANGRAQSAREHNAYIQSIDPLIQFNYFGEIKSNALGGNLKDRSAGTVVRYNWFEGGGRLLDLVEPEEHIAYVLLDRYYESLNGTPADPEMVAWVTENEAKYSIAHAYGNVFGVVGSHFDMSAIVHYGADNVPEDRRRGTLYFYNNTIDIRSTYGSQADGLMSRVAIFDQGVNWGEAVRPNTIRADNNIIWLEPESGVGGGNRSILYLTKNQADHLELGRNLVYAGWNVDPDHGYGGLGPGAVTGTSALVAATARPIRADRTPTIDSPAIDAATELPAAAFQPLEQIRPPFGREPRFLQGSSVDLGAFEWSDRIFEDGYE